MTVTYRLLSRPRIALVTGVRGGIGAKNVRNAGPDGYKFLTTTTAMICIM